MHKADMRLMDANNPSQQLKAKCLAEQFSSDFINNEKWRDDTGEFRLTWIQFHFHMPLS